MRYLFGLIAAGALLGSGSLAHAQLSISIGNPYGGFGYSGMPYASGYGGYSSYAYPGTTFYSSGYSGYAYPSVVPTYVAPVYSYGYVPAYGYGPAYGYRYRRGIPNRNRFYRRYGFPY